MDALESAMDRYIKGIKNEIEAIEEELKKYGYKYENGKVVLDQNKKDLFPVLEILCFNNTNYESSGTFYLIKKIVKVNNEFFEKFKNISIKYDNRNSMNFSRESLETREEINDLFSDICNIIDREEFIPEDYDFPDDEFRKLNYMKFGVTEEENLSEESYSPLYQLYFDRGEADSSYPHGYVDVYITDMETFKEEVKKNVDVCTSKRF